MTLIERLEATVDCDWLADEVEQGRVPALSIKQPYPHCIFHRGKDVENRDWRTNRRGWVMVHAGVSTSEIGPNERHLPRGGIVGMMKIVDCVDQMDSDWFYGRFGFVISEAFPLPLIGCRGALGFFAVEPEIRSLVAASIKARGCE